MYIRWDLETIAKDNAIPHDLGKNVIPGIKKMTYEELSNRRNTAANLWRMGRTPSTFFCNI